MSSQHSEIYAQTSQIFQSSNNTLIRVISYIQVSAVDNHTYVYTLKGYSGFKNPFSRLSLFGFTVMFDHVRVHIQNIDTVAHS